MHKFNEMVFTLDRYESEDDMWADVTKFIRILINNDYIMVVRDDDVDIIVVEYEHNEYVEAWGCPNPHWITEDEFCSIINDDSEEEAVEELPFN